MSKSLKLMNEWFWTEFNVDWSTKLESFDFFKAQVSRRLQVGSTLQTTVRSFTQNCDILIKYLSSVGNVVCIVWHYILKRYLHSLQHLPNNIKIFNFSFVSSEKTWRLIVERSKFYIHFPNCASLLSQFHSFLSKSFTNYMFT